MQNLSTYHESEHHIPTPIPDHSTSTPTWSDTYKEPSYHTTPDDDVNLLFGLDQQRQDVDPELEAMFTNMFPDVVPAYGYAGAFGSFACPQAGPQWSSFGGDGSPWVGAGEGSSWMGGGVEYGEFGGQAVRVDGCAGGS